MKNTFLRMPWYGTAAVVICSTMAGCFGSNFGADVQGVVSLDGKPIGPGVVVFAPVSGEENPATGAIQVDGSYFLKTSRERGLRPGSYKVAVQIHEIPTDRAYGERDMRPIKFRIPEKFTTVTTSNLEFDVEDGSNTIDIPLTSG
jgi:hypothetical protein